MQPLGWEGMAESVWGISDLVETRSVLCYQGNEYESLNTCQKREQDHEGYASLAVLPLDMICFFQSCCESLRKLVLTFKVTNTQNEKCGAIPCPAGIYVRHEVDIL